jgi:hypothetical protein
MAGRRESGELGRGDGGPPKAQKATELTGLPKVPELSK